MGERPPWMEKVAEAGGWEEARKLREQKEFMDSMAKIPPESWQNMRLSMQGLNEFVKAGGSNELITSFQDHVKDTLEANIAAAMSPLTNAIDQIIGDALKPVWETLNVVSNSVADFIAQGPTGGAWGGVIGSILGTVIAGPTGTLLGEILGAIIGSYVESAVSKAFLDWKSGETRPSPDIFQEFMKNALGPWFTIWWLLTHPAKSQATDLPLHGYIKELE